MRETWRKLEPAEYGGMTTRMDGKVELWKDAASEWRFHFRHRNGNIVVWSEGYANRVDAIASAAGCFPSVDIFEATD